ncbi:hypothetical protein M5X06_12770 [Paenibacillus alvei]|uniref:Uncharacterized protein n=1 Tax=Paenibacillus alvei TaxID=44250 RepID=A0ABT4GUY6_PAEAL|nr:hypothetical protein [Paenibacillus alvei]MCY9760393.1 hypothetical protein [Paenibacillus alvei]MCY9767685.1 hypothetical protein [Paenibacillus alvei]
MSSEIYVILIDDKPYRKDGAIRTYKTRERAEKEARRVSRYWSYRDRKFEVGVFAPTNVIELPIEPRDNYEGAKPHKNRSEVSV